MFVIHLSHIERFASAVEHAQVHCQKNAHKSYYQPIMKFGTLTFTVCTYLVINLTA